MGRSRGDYFELKELFDYIDLARGFFAIGFMRRTEDWDQSGILDLSERIRKPGGIISYLPGDVVAGVAHDVMSKFQYYHCEPAFYLSERGKEVFGADKLLCVRSEKKTPVQIYARTFHGEYTWVNIAADINELRGVVAYCCNIQGAMFNEDAMGLCLTSPGPDTRKSFYCSYLCASLLELLDHPVGHLNRPNTLSIDDLYALVQSCKPEMDIHRPDSFWNHLYGK